MRKILTLAMLFFCATAVQAQERPAAESGERAVAQSAPAQVAPGAAETVPAPEARVPAVDGKTRSATSADISAARLRAPVDVDEPANAIAPPRDFWWIVGAIVLAGIILSILL